MSDVLAVWDTREPEGDGSIIMCVCGCNEVPMLFVTHDEAAAWCTRNGIDVERVKILPLTCERFEQATLSQ